MLIVAWTDSGPCADNGRLDEIARAMIRIFLMRLTCEVFPPMPQRHGPGIRWHNRWGRQKRSDCSKAWSVANGPGKEAAYAKYRARVNNVATQQATGEAHGRRSPSAEHLGARSAVLRRQRHGLGARRYHGHDGGGDDRGLWLTKEGRAVLAALLAKGFKDLREPMTQRRASMLELPSPGIMSADARANISLLQCNTSLPSRATCRLTQCSEHRHQREPRFTYKSRGVCIFSGWVRPGEWEELQCCKTAASAKNQRGFIVPRLICPRLSTIGAKIPYRRALSATGVAGVRSLHMGRLL